MEAKQQTHTFKGLDDRIEIFRVGKHEDSAKNTRVWLAEELQEMVDTFSADDPFPHVYGHPEHDDPAHGWAAKVSFEDGTLYLDESKDLNPNFVKCVDSGAFRKRSISVGKNKEGKFKIRHLGWLGAVGPAVEGMAPLQYTAADDEQIFEFAMTDRQAASKIRRGGWSLRNLGGLLRRLREHTIEKDGIDAADKLVPQYEIDNVVDGGTALSDVRATDSAEEIGSLYSHPDAQKCPRHFSGDEKTDKINPASHGVTAEDEHNNEDHNMSDKDKGAAVTTAAQFTQADLDAKEKAAEERAELRFKHKADCKDFISSLMVKDEMKITPAQLPFVEALFEQADNAATFNFSDGSGAEEKELTQVDVLKMYFNSLPANFAHLTKELVTDDDAPGEAGSHSVQVPAGYSVDPDAAKLHSAAMEYQAKHPETTYIAAVNAVNK